MNSNYQLVASMSLTLVLVFGILFGLLIGIGYYYNIGIYSMVVLAIVFSVIQWYVGPVIIKRMMRMKSLDPKKYPWIKDTVEKFCLQNKLKIPKLLISETSMPNACVFGRTTSSCHLAITKGLLSQLSQDEVKAVIAHEVGHIKHKDMVVMTVISVIPTIAYMIAISTMFRGMMGGGGGRNSGGAVLIGLGAFAVYMITNLLILYFSRLREFYSDRFAGIQTKRPSDLANALAKISYGITMEKQRETKLGWSQRQQEEQGQHVSERAFFIADPVNAGKDFLALAERYKSNGGGGDSKQKEILQISRNMADEVKKAIQSEKRKANSSMIAKVGEMFMTHPPTYKRIEQLYILEEELKQQQNN